MPDGEGRGGRPAGGPTGPIGPIGPLGPIRPPRPDPLLVGRPAPLTVLRTSDMVLVRFSFVNLRWVPVGRGRGLAVEVPGRPAYLITDFPPQHLIEEAFAERSPADPPASIAKRPELPVGSKTDPPPKPTNDTKLPDVPPVQASLSAGSRLVFRVDDRIIPWSLDGLLEAMTRLPLNVAPHAENPFRIAIPVEHPVITAIRNPGSVQRVPDGIRAAGRLAATARVLDQRLGRQASIQITAASRFAAELRLPAQPTLPIAWRKPPPPRSPTTTETAIELPWRLQLSPPSTSGFMHSAVPVEHDDRIELWHSRLGSRGTDGVDDSHGTTVRAIWARDMERPLAPLDPQAMGETDIPDFTKSLTTHDRQMLVDETSNFNLLRDGQSWTPPAVDVDRLMLTALGGWLSSDFNAPQLPDGGCSITEWKHRATMGRDHEVKVVYAGFLFPFGHAASLIKVTERKIDTRDGLPGLYAYLRQRFFIVVRQPSITYDAGSTTWSDTGRRYVPITDHGVKSLNLAMPFSSVNILTRVTPDLDPPHPEMPGDFCFIPSVANAPFPFKILAADREGHIVEYGGPLMFIERGRNQNSAELDKVVETYWRLTEDKRRHELHGQRLAFAAATDENDTPLDTTLSTEQLQFDAAVLDKKRTQDEPGFWPVLRTATVVSPAMNALAGVATRITMKQPNHYLAKGFEDNKCHVFLEVADGAAAAGMDFAQQADRSGGFVSPSLAVTGLSGSKGPIGGDISEAIAGSVNPASFFSGMSAKLFGAIDLVKLLPTLPPEKMPSFVAGAVNQVTGLLDDVRRLTNLAIDDPVFTTAKNHALAVLDAFGDLSKLGGAVPLITTLAGDLPALNAAIDTAAKANSAPAARLAEAAGIVRRLTEHTASAEGIADLVDAAGQLLDGANLPEAFGATMSWSTTLNEWPKGAAIFQPVKNGHPVPEGHLDLHVDIQPPTGSDQQPTTTVACSISPFSLRLIGDTPFISLNVDVMEFTMVAGRKPDVNVVLREGNGVEFGGPLSFVNALQSVIPFDGFSDPPYLDVDAQGITAGFDLAIPNIAIGVLSLCNISLGAKALVPFIGDSLDFTFSFCTRENPFRLTVWLFGGGGFFAITVTPERCRMLEASFEFGAAVALDFGVASGSIECMAGIYFKLEFGPTGDDSELAGYFRLRGEVDVLGLISASIELYLEISYEPSSGKATGRASLSIEVEVLFLSFSVEIECEKKFKGSNQDPSFLEVMGEIPPGGVRPWDEYCNAFAAG